MSKRPIKAYRDARFMSSPDARTLRMLAEYVEPESRFCNQGIDRTIVFFGSARALPLEAATAALAQARETGVDGAALDTLEMQLQLARYYEDARSLSALLTRWALETTTESGEPFVICSGGGPGIMEACNRGASEAGGRSIGLNISLPAEQEPNPYITDELNLDFHYFFMRKLWFVQLACAAVVFPGGYGTLDELAELLTLIQTGRSSGMPVVLYGSQYWEEVLNFEALERWGTIEARDLELIHRCDTPEDAFSYLKSSLESELTPSEASSKPTP